MVNVLQYKRIAIDTTYKFVLLDAVCRSLNKQFPTESLEHRAFIKILPLLAKNYDMSIPDLLEKDTTFYNDFSKISDCFERFHDLVLNSLSESDRRLVQLRRYVPHEMNFRQVGMPTSEHEEVLLDGNPPSFHLEWLRHRENGTPLPTLRSKNHVVFDERDSVDAIHPSRNIQFKT